jgi:hypothetical protein
MFWIETSWGACACKAFGDKFALSVFKNTLIQFFGDIVPEVSAYGV